MKLIYICSPYAGEVESNVEKAKEYCKYVIKEGNAPLAVHLLYPQILNDDNQQEREMGLMFGLKLLSVCDEIWIFGGRISEGMRTEIQAAKKMKIPRRYVSSKETEKAKIC